MLDYADFYSISEYGNKNWKGSFTPYEIACNAYDYKIEYDYSFNKGKPTNVMNELCKLICEDCEDMNFSDYSGSENSLTIWYMDSILEKFVMKIFAMEI